MTTRALLRDPRREATAQVHARIAPPLLALAFALLAVPLARSSPRQTRFGSVVIGFLTYLVGMDMMLLEAAAQVLLGAVQTGLHGLRRNAEAGSGVLGTELLHRPPHEDGEIGRASGRES